jgi:hypothetical protein
MTVTETVTDAIESLQTTSASSSSHLIWVDMPCHLTPTSSSSHHHWDCLTAQEIDHNLQRILNHTHSGDVVCVLTQGDLLEVKKLMCHKQK